LKLWDPLHISATIGARNLKFDASKQNANIRDDQYVKSKPEVYSNMADVRFLKSEVVITQAWFVLSYRNLVLR